MFRLLLVLTLLLTARPSAATEAAQAVLDQALAQARERRQPLLVDFHAPWCYSCYYMKRNVLTGAEWQALQQQVVLLSLDADSPEGAHWKNQWQVKAIPAYLLLDGDGQEIGRILAEQTRPAFYAQMAALTARSTPLTGLRQRAREATPDGRAAAAEVLAAFAARRAAEEGLAWWLQLPMAVRSHHQAEPAVRLGRDRLELIRAEAAKDLPTCSAAAAAVLDNPALGCDYAYELQRWLSCSSGLAAEPRKALFAPRRTAVEARLARDAAACADQRSVVFAAADFQQALGNEPARRAVLDRAIDQARSQLGTDLASDRNQADNLRVFLERAGRVEELDALMPRLIAAWPQDYVYPFRHGRSLLARGRAAEALPFLDQAAPLAYGLNRLKVAEQRVQALQALDRAEEARRVVAEALKANGPWFPEDAAALRRLIER